MPTPACSFRTATASRACTRCAVRWSCATASGPSGPPSTMNLDRIARRQPQLFRFAAVELEHVARRRAARIARARVADARRHVVLDADELPVAVEEQHVERDLRVLHPEAARLIV